MSSVNKVILVGRVGKDVVVRYAASGDAVCSLSLATSERWKDKSSGVSKEQTEWHNIVMYKKLAEIAGKYVKKGDQIYVEGSLHTRKWTDKNGAERYTTEVKTSSMTMLSVVKAHVGSKNPDAEDVPF